MRIGQGFDIHRLIEGKPLKLGGVHIVDSPMGSEAHSDGDVLLHALIDALLGAAGLGDIGEHFPPSDPQYAGADSTELLQQVLPLLRQAGYALINIDSTVFLETPKLGPYKASIRQRLAQVLALPETAVSVKAKTAEGLGAIGSSQAVAASVVVLLQAIP